MNGLLLFLPFLGLWAMLNRRRKEELYKKEEKEKQKKIDDYYKKDMISVKKLATRYKHGK